MQRHTLKITLRNITRMIQYKNKIKSICKTENNILLEDEILHILKNVHETRHFKHSALLENKKTATHFKNIHWDAYIIHE